MIYQSTLFDSNSVCSAWQTAGRPRQSQSASRTPTSRSNNASPSQPGTPQPPSRPDTSRSQQAPANNAWAQKPSITSTSNGQVNIDAVTATSQPGDEGYQSVNGFNATEVKAFLSRDASALPDIYKPTENTGGGSRSAWGSKRQLLSVRYSYGTEIANESAANQAANNQPFFVQLAKQIATLEGGG